MVKVSLVVPVYNTEKYLRRCLESVAAQSLAEIEVLVVDDGSPDNSAAIIREFAARDTRFRLLATPNGGVAKARNLGLDAASGEYVTFVDSDDSIRPKLAESLYEAAKKNGADIAVCNLIRFYENGRQEAPFIDFHGHTLLFPKENHYAYVKKVFIGEEGLAGSVCNKLFRREWLLSTGVRFLARDFIFAEDTMFLYQVLPQAQRVCIVDQPLYLYRQHGSSESHIYQENLLGRYRNLLEQTIQTYQDLGVYLDIVPGIPVKSFAFLSEILYNETKKGGSYRKFREAVHDSYFQERTKTAQVSHLSRNKRLAFALYRRRFTWLLYVLYRLRHGGVAG